MLTEEKEAKVKVKSVVQDLIEGKRVWVKTSYLEFRNGKLFHTGKFRLFPKQLRFGDCPGDNTIFSTEHYKHITVEEAKELVKQEGCTNPDTANIVLSYFQ